MSDAANNALLFEEEIDRRIIAALGTAFTKPLDQEVSYLVRAMLSHSEFRSVIQRIIQDEMLHFMHSQRIEQEKRYLPMTMYEKKQRYW